MFVSPLRIVFLIALLALAWPLARAEVSEKRIELLFRPPLGERMALSPDGRYLAYTQHARGELVIVIFDLERMEVKTRITADEDRPILHSKEKQRAELRFLEWADGNRLVFAPTVETIAPVVRIPTDLSLMSPEAAAVMAGVPPLEPTVIAPIMAVDADGSNPQQILGAKEIEALVVGESSIEGPARVRARTPGIKGFAAGERHHLLIELPGYGQVPTELFQLDVRNGKMHGLQREPPTGRMIYDWQGRPRMMLQSEGRGSTDYYLYRPTDSSRWRKLTTLRGAAGFDLSPATYFGERSIPLGFDFDPNVLIYASNVGRDTFALYGLNLVSGQRASLAIEHPGRDLANPGATVPAPTLVFDELRGSFAGVRAEGAPPLTLWMDPELAGVQRSLDAKYPQRTVHLLQWNRERTRFLVRMTGGTEPGRIYLHQRPDDLEVELMRATPWLPNSELHASRYVEFPGPDGVRLGAHLTFPRKPRLNPPPLIVWFAPGLPPEAHGDFDAQAQVLADMGFVVCRLNNRGVLGRGARHRDALRRDFDGAPAADALAAVEWIASNHRVDRKRVVTFGEGFAGYLAVRAAQVHPEAFRCAVAIRPVLEMATWAQPFGDLDVVPFRSQVAIRYLEGHGARLSQLSAIKGAGAMTSAVFLVAHAQPRTEEEQAINAGISRLRGQLKRRDVACVAVAADAEFTLGLPVARARVYRELEEFFNLNLYNYDVKIGPTRVVR
jgi:dipeptidyl aminopeptidase/acylaminoacyl peptidase